MPAIILSFLIALVQFFHSGGNEMACATSAQTYTVASQDDNRCAIHAVSGRQLLREIIETEEAPETEEDYDQALKLIPAPLVITRFFYTTAPKQNYAARSFGSFNGQAPLFVMYCTFRV